MMHTCVVCVFQYLKSNIKTLKIKTILKPTTKHFMQVYIKGQGLTTSLHYKFSISAPSIAIF